MKKQSIIYLVGILFFLTLSGCACLTETTFQRRFAQAVDIVNSGQTLPIDPPAYN